jgi:hypothetical protein
MTQALGRWHDAKWYDLDVPPLSRRSSFYHAYGEALLTIGALATTGSALALGWRDRAESDFAVFYQAAVALRRGADPYQVAAGRNLSPPALAVLMQPFTLLSFDSTVVVWTVASLVSVVLCAQAIARHTPDVSRTTVMLVLLATQPLAYVINQGQITALIMLPLLTLAWLADRSGRSLQAGLALGALIYFKPFYGVLALYLLWRRAWRTCAGIGSGYLVCVLIGLVAGPHTYVSWLTALGDVPHGGGFHNASIEGLALRLFRGNPDTVVTPIQPLIVSHTLEQATRVVGIAFVVVTSAWAVARARNRDDVWATLSIAGVLLSPLGWMYYLPASIGPLTAAITRDRRWPFAVVVGALLAVPISVLAGHRYSGVWTITIASIYFWCVLLLWAGLVFCPNRVERATPSCSEMS